MGGVSTTLAKEFALRTPIGFFNMPTSMAALTRVRRINRNKRHAHPLGFVRKEGSQLCERPIAALRPSFLTINPSPRGNASQIFDGNPALRVFRGCNES